MSSPSKAVDVMAVLDELVSFEERMAEAEPRANHEAREARAAVAELIAADKEYDDAITNLSAINRSIAECGWIEVEHDALRQASKRLVTARMRRWDALAALTGAVS